MLASRRLRHALRGSKAPFARDASRVLRPLCDFRHCVAHYMRHTWRPCVRQWTLRHVLEAASLRQSLRRTVVTSDPASLFNGRKQRTLTYTGAQHTTLPACGALSQRPLPRAKDAARDASSVNPPPPSPGRPISVCFIYLAMNEYTSASQVYFLLRTEYISTHFNVKITRFVRNVPEKPHPVWPRVFTGAQ